MLARFRRRDECGGRSPNPTGVTSSSYDRTRIERHRDHPSLEALVRQVDSSLGGNSFSAEDADATWCGRHGVRSGTPVPGGRRSNVEQEDDHPYVVICSRLGDVASMSLSLGGCCATGRCELRRPPLSSSYCGQLGRAHSHRQTH